MYVIDDVAYAGEPREGIKVASARVVNDLSMLVTFSTGETRLFDASPLLAMPAFEELADPETFARFEVSRGVVCWAGGEIDLAPEKMYELSYAYEKTA